MLLFSKESVYIASLVKIIVPLVYATSVVIGFGAAILWVAQGAFLTKCSDESTRGRNSGIFWGIFQLSGTSGYNVRSNCSGIIGNFSAYFILDFNEPPSVLFLVLTVCGICGVIVLLILRPVKDDDEGSLFHC